MGDVENLLQRAKNLKGRWKNHPEGMEYAHSLLYDALKWTKNPNLEAFTALLEEVEAEKFDDLGKVRKRLMCAGFELSPPALREAVRVLGQARYRSLRRGRRSP